MKPDPNHPATATESLREQAEARLREQRVAVSRRQSDADNYRLLHELEVHQVELEMQNHALLDLREQLERSLEKYTDLYDFAPVGYLTVTDDGTIREANLAAAALLGLERARLINRRLGVFIAAETRPTFNAFLERVWVGTAREHCEITLAHDDGALCHLHLEGVAVLSGADRWCHLAAMDITERKRAEEAARASEQASRKMMEELREERDRFAKIVATVPGGIFSFRLRPDGSTCCPYVSPIFADLYGLHPEDLAESAAPLWAIIHPDDLDQVRASVAASARTLTPWRDEFRWRR
ncbi:MAG TPA: PAS domain-containing protein, partial [Candidatus Contendobacter sp.]|nr:PAS domain-containing protein [Candidatus Contendobacter sp.]